MYVVLCLIVFGCQYQCNWLPGKTRLWNDLLCVEWDVKPYTFTHSHSLSLVTQKYNHRDAICFRFRLYIRQNASYGFSFYGPIKRHSNSHLNGFWSWNLPSTKQILTILTMYRRSITNIRHSATYGCNIYRPIKRQSHSNPFGSWNWPSCLIQLHWLPICHRTAYRLCTLMHNVHIGKSPFLIKVFFKTSLKLIFLSYPSTLSRFYQFVFYPSHIFCFYHSSVITVTLYCFALMF